MAKSLRSKWKRKCRAIKRERYAVKELDRLKKTLGIDDNVSKDVEMTEITEIATGMIQVNALIVVYLNSYSFFFIIVYIIM